MASNTAIAAGDDGLETIHLDDGGKPRKRRSSIGSSPLSFARKHISDKIKGHSLAQGINLGSMKRLRRTRQAVGAVDSKVFLGQYAKAMPVEILRNTFSDRTRCIATAIAAIRPGSSCLLSALRFLDRSNRKTKEIRELATFSIFLVLFTVATLADSNEDDYNFVKVLSSHFTEEEFDAPYSHVRKSFADVETVADIHDYLEDPFFRLVTSSDSFDGEAPVGGAANLTGGSASALNRRGHVAGYNRVLGAVRVGTLRVKDRACELPAELTLPAWDDADADDSDSDSGSSTGEEAPRCFPGFSGADEDTAAFGYPSPVFEAVDRAALGWDAEPTYISPQTGDRFPSPAFAVLLNATDAAGTRASLRALRTHKYVDLKTRALIVDLNVYNPQLDRMCLVRLAVEIYPSGRVVTGTIFRSLQLFRWHTMWDVAREVLNGLIMLFVVHYTAIELRSARKMGLYHYASHRFMTLNTILHWMNLLLFYGAFGCRMYAVYRLPTKARTRAFVARGGSADFFTELLRPSYWLEVARNVNALNARKAYLSDRRNLLPLLLRSLATTYSFPSF